MLEEYTKMILPLRVSRGYTQDQLGLLSGMGKSQISRMENGHLGSYETLTRVLSAMGYDVKIELIDRVSRTAGDKERILDVLNEYFINNKKRHGINRLGLFGSYSRGDHTPESDVDVCILLDKPSLVKYSVIKDELEMIIKKEVDLVPLNSKMRSKFEENLKKDLIYVEGR